MQRESFPSQHHRSLVRPDRFFFALRPPAREARRAAAFAERVLEPGWHIQSPPRLHVTLAITEDFGIVPPDLVQRLTVIGDRVAAAPFPITFDRLSISHRAATLRLSHSNAALVGLHRAIRDEWSKARLTLRSEWSFAPHMTLAYRDGNRPETRPVERFGWLADELVLIRSLVGLTRHETLGLWPLRAAAPAQFSLF